MTFLMLRPKNDFLDVHGRISYSESSGAWSRILLRSSIINRFPELKEKTQQFGYRLLFFETYEELKAFLKINEEKKEAVPFLMWLFRE